MSSLTHLLLNYNNFKNIKPETIMLILQDFSMCKGMTYLSIQTMNSGLARHYTMVILVGTVQNRFEKLASRTLKESKFISLMQGSIKIEFG